MCSSEELGQLLRNGRHDCLAAAPATPELAPVGLKTRIHIIICCGLPESLLSYTALDSHLHRIYSSIRTHVEQYEDTQIVVCRH